MENRVEESSRKLRGREELQMSFIQSIAKGTVEIALSFVISLAIGSSILGILILVRHLC